MLQRYNDFRLVVISVPTFLIVNVYVLRAVNVCVLPTLREDEVPFFIKKSSLKEKRALLFYCYSYLKEIGNSYQPFAVRAYNDTRMQSREDERGAGDVTHVSRKSKFCLPEKPVRHAIAFDVYCHFNEIARQFH